MPMPTISEFYGITIRMYFQQKEHNPPHIHAIYGGTIAAISINEKEIIDGSIPLKAFNLVKEWMVLHEKELLKIWESQEFNKIPPLI